MAAICITSTKECKMDSHSKKQKNCTKIIQCTCHVARVAALKYQFVAIFQFGTLFSPMQKHTTSQTNAYEGICHLFDAKINLCTNIINHKWNSGNVINFALGLTDIYGNGFNGYAWIDTLRISDCDSDPNSTIEKLRSGVLKGHLPFLDYSSESSDDSSEDEYEQYLRYHYHGPVHKKKSRKFYNDKRPRKFRKRRRKKYDSTYAERKKFVNLRLELAAALMLDNKDETNGYGINIINKILCF